MVARWLFLAAQYPTHSTPVGSLLIAVTAHILSDVGAAAVVGYCCYCCQRIYLPNGWYFSRATCCRTNGWWHYSRYRPIRPPSRNLLRTVGRHLICFFIAYGLRFRAIVNVAVGLGI